MDSPLRERLHRAIQDADTGKPEWQLRPAYAPLADAALSTLTLSDHIAAVAAAGLVAVPAEPTDAMIEAGFAAEPSGHHDGSPGALVAIWSDEIRAEYAAMLAARPR